MTRRPTIVLDAMLVSARPKGAGRVLRNLIEVLPEVDREHEYVALVRPDIAAALRPSTAARLVPVSPRSGLLWEIRGVQRAAAAANGELLFTVRELVGFGGVPTVLHLFEAPSWRVSVEDRDATPGWKHRAKDALLAGSLAGSLRRAAAVTSGSEATAEFIRRRHGVDSEVVLPGIDRVFLNAHPPRRDERYFVHLASGDPRENTELVLRAFAEASTGGAALKTFGSPAPVRESIRARALELGIAERVEVLEWVSDEDLLTLYANALALVHPSRYESFAGLPALEAMALGTAVIALDAPGATEALTGAAELVPTEDRRLLASALERIADDPGHREGLGRVGRERAATLTWEASAGAFAEVFARALARQRASTSS